VCGEAAARVERRTQASGRRRGPKNQAWGRRPIELISACCGGADRTVVRVRPRSRVRRRCTACMAGLRAQ